MRKHRIFFVVFFFCFQFTLQAFEFGRISFSLQPSVGLLTGRMQEIVYAREGVLSRLDWEHTAIPFAGLDAKISFRKAFVRLGALAGLPSKTGYLEDRDFMTFTQNPTHFSRHELETQRLFAFSLFGGYDFRVGKATLSASAGLISKRHKWNARNGYGIYSYSGNYKELPSLDYGFNFDSTFRRLKEEFANRDVITYEQKIYLLALGFDAAYKVNKNFTLLSGLNFFPHLYVEDLDLHHLRTEEYAQGLQFYDFMLGGIGGSVSVGFEIFRFSLGLKYEYFISFYGGTNSGPIGEHLSNLKAGGTSGVASHVFAASLGYKLE